MAKQKRGNPPLINPAETKQIEKATDERVGNTHGVGSDAPPVQPRTDHGRDHGLFTDPGDGTIGNIAHKAGEALEEARKARRANKPAANDAPVD
jgi:hypothetical protein